MSYITGLGGTPGAGWYTDNNGHPKLWVAAETWGLPTNAGAWHATTGGTYQQDFDNFFSERAAQGLTVLMTDPFGNTADGGTYDNGNTWDNVSPFTGGSVHPSAGLNSTFWTRIDYMLNSALSNNITVAFSLNTTYDSTAGTIMSTWTSTDFTDYGTAIGGRYASQANLIWLFGNDSFPGTEDSLWDAFYTALKGTGYSLPVGAWWSAEYTSRYETDNNTAATWGETNSPVNFCYTYNAGYWVIEYAYGEVVNQGQAHLLPTIIGDGYFYQGGTSYSSTYDRAYRQECWWVLAAGARGFLTESEGVWQWPSTAPAAVTGEWFSANNLKNIVSTFSGWTGWNYLLPDLSSALVTAGRGTRVSGYPSGGGGGQYEPAFTNSWVSASKTPDGTLAVCYLPNHTTITVNTALLATGWTASWIDPITGASSSAGAGPTFNSTAKGTNSQSENDWVLVFQAPSGAPAPPAYAYSMGMALWR